MMTCISPPEPEDRLLMAFLDGEADPETILHLKECQHCGKRVESLAREQKLLTSRFFRITCPSATELGEYHLHMLTAPQMLMVSQHLRDCPYCPQEINQLEEFLSDLGPAPESSLLGRAKVLIAKLVSGGKPSGLTGDPAFALRGESEGPMTFQVGGNLIVIDIQQTSDGKLNLLGQVAADQQDDWTDASVSLRQENQPERKTKVDDLGAFQFEDVLRGFIDLEIEARDGTVVVIPTFEGSN
jgi:hypothetical protein